jgi:molybdenum cofactor biosynthesis enzyme MoaA
MPVRDFGRFVLSAQAAQCFCLTCCRARLRGDRGWAPQIERQMARVRRVLDTFEPIRRMTQNLKRSRTIQARIHRFAKIVRNQTSPRLSLVM